MYLNKIYTTSTIAGEHSAKYIPKAFLSSYFGCVAVAFLSYSLRLNQPGSSCFNILRTNQNLENERPTKKTVNPEGAKKGKKLPTVKSVNEMIKTHL